MPLAPGLGTPREPDSPHYPAGPLGGAVHADVGPRHLAARVQLQASSSGPGRDARVQEGGRDDDPA